MAAVTSKAPQISAAAKRPQEGDGQGLRTIIFGWLTVKSVTLAPDGKILSYNRAQSVKSSLIATLFF